MDNQKIDYLFKIVLIGDSNVGKTSILSRLVKNTIPEESKPTIGVEFGTKTFTIDGTVIKAQIWDTAGQERYHAITTAYYRGSNGAVVVYDVTNKNSIENASTVWLKNLRYSADPNIPAMLLGNKADLEKKREVSTMDGFKTALGEKTGYFETSAVSGENITKAFETFINHIYKIEKEKENSPAKVKVRREDLTGEQLNTAKSNKKKKSGCC
ncbi:Ras-related protein Rab-11A [Pancytospora epiphaga]|nr:Ras-related protein Rab-11A [Pancytospora epiphaga]